jgi:hypothetical protein
MFKKLMLLLSYGPEIEELLKKQKNAKADAEFEAKKHNLNLCLKHSQEQSQSHYSKHNCDHCKLIKTLENVSQHISPSKGFPHDVMVLDELNQVRKDSGKNYFFTLMGATRPMRGRP